ncbi:transcriptional regulator [Kordiimonas sediminis]|uniref:Transcriptional regulator n=1 Tax=Kordiimonas sediminis TaxID=1735581 RepID=A0A919EAR5_9PROT|nr:helix-turn-helix domain-containing protein [Kordiimonas sediminis]GHF31000.1 transcriptional regulator [Kordiimonas sediminis]
MTHLLPKADGRDVSVAFVLFDNFEALDLTGPRSVLAMGNDVAGCAFKLTTLSVTDQMVTTECGLTLKADRLVAEGDQFDIVFFPGGAGCRQLDLSAADRRRLVDLCNNATLVATVCTGAYILAELGLLDNKASGIHWDFEEDFRKRYPKVAVDGVSLYLHDGKYWSSGGVTAGIDMTLVLLSRLYGDMAAGQVARHLNLYVRRPGNQAQFSAPLSLQTAQNKEIEKILNWVLDHPADAASVTELAEIAGLSERTLIRRCKKLTGLSPARYVERIRLDLARQSLLSPDISLKTVAAQSGFSSVDSFSRAFERVFEMRPAAYRALLSKVLET